MQKVYFRYKEHPGDFLRDDTIEIMHNPKEDLENFLIWFLPWFQSDQDVAYINDLYKLYYDEFESEEEKNIVLPYCELETKEEIMEEINRKYDQLKKEAFENFYNLVMENKIEIIVKE